MKLCGTSNSLCACITRMITNHAHIDSDSSWSYSISMQWISDRNEKTYSFWMFKIQQILESKEGISLRCPYFPRIQPWSILFPGRYYVRRGLFLWTLVFSFSFSFSFSFISFSSYLSRYVITTTVYHYVLFFFLIQQFITWITRAGHGSYVITIYKRNRLTQRCEKEKEKEKDKRKQERTNWNEHEERGIYD